MKAKISPAFQICIPQTVRVLLRLNVADYLRFVERDGKIYVEKADDE
jgi:AbrB family looped-hinge helix DNA binding protein